MKSWYNQSENKKRKIIFSILIGVTMGSALLCIILFRMNYGYVWPNASRIKEVETDKIYSAHYICDNGQIVRDPDSFFILKNDGTYIFLEGSTDDITEENYGEYFGEGSIEFTTYMKGKYEKKDSGYYDLLESETETVTLSFWDYEHVKEHRPNTIEKTRVGEYKAYAGYIPNKICKDEQGWKFIVSGYGHNIEYLIREDGNEKLPESIDEFLADYQ